MLDLSFMKNRKILIKNYVDKVKEFQHKVIGKRIKNDNSYENGIIKNLISLFEKEYRSEIKLM